MTVTCVRPMLRADLPAVLAIEAQANPVPWKAPEFEAFLTDPAGSTAGPGHAAWVWAGPEIQGFACAMGAADEAELQTIAVARDRWGLGIGSALVATLIDWARARSARVLHLEVREGNARALEFYGRWGFAITGRRPRYYRDNGETALLMAKTL
jgi:ribosomal-protein-alanine N-acetyltransferase